MTSRLKKGRKQSVIGRVILIYASPVFYLSITQRGLVTNVIRDKQSVLKIKKLGERE